MDFKSVIKEFEKSRHILLTSHVNPDGDAVGSMLALYHFFSQKGHFVKMILPNMYPDFLAWMPGCRNIIIYEDDKQKSDELFGNAEIIFSLDYNSPPRIGEASESLKKSDAVKILIDHHINPDKDFYDFIFSTTETSSTAELVYNFIKTIDVTTLNRNIATCLYTGILTDTGSFSYSCEKSETFAVASRLVDEGISPGGISRLIYDTYSASRIRLLGYTLKDKLTVLPEYCSAFISLSRKELDFYQFKVGDTEGFVNYALGIKGIKFAAFLTEKEGKIRLSFRSKGDFNVNDFARTHFEGGGHKNAAGGDSFLNMEDTIGKLKELISRYKDKICNS